MHGISAHTRVDDPDLGTRSQWVGKGKQSVLNYIISTNKQAKGIKLHCHNCTPFCTWPWLWKRIYGLTILLLLTFCWKLACANLAAWQQNSCCPIPTALRDKIFPTPRPSETRSAPSPRPSETRYTPPPRPSETRSAPPPRPSETSTGRRRTRCLGNSSAASGNFNARHHLRRRSTSVSSWVNKEEEDEENVVLTRCRCAQPPCVYARTRRSCTHVKRLCSPCQISVEYGNTKRQSMRFADWGIHALLYSKWNSRIMICTLSSAYWQQDSKRSALRRFESIWKDWDKNAPITTIIQ